MPRWNKGLPVALAVLVALTCLFALRGGSKRPNVLWITIDSCRYDHLGCYGYSRAHTPNIDALASEGAIFTQAISQASATRFSIPSMVTGRYSLTSQARGFANEPPEDQKTLAEFLVEMGYGTLVITQEDPVKAAARGFARIEGQAKSTSQRTLACIQAIRELKEEAFFIWLYYWDPHAPYRPPPHFLKLFESQLGDQTQDSSQSNSRKPTAPKRLSGESFIERRKKTLQESGGASHLRDQTGRLSGELIVLGQINSGIILPTGEDQRHLINLYDAEIAFVDSEIGKVMDELQRSGLWDKTLLLITADHGEAFGEHSKYYHGLNLYDEVVRVPLIIKPPHSSLAGKRLTAQVRNLDIMPTILEYCGAPIPGDLDAISLRPALRGNPLQNQPAYLETYFRERNTAEHLFLGFRTGTHKLIYDLIQGTAELYDLKEDPGEKVNLVPSSAGEETRPPIGPQEEKIREAFLEHLGLENLQQLARMKLTEKMDRTTEERLRALGYIQ
jgi:hypothetical protein